MVLQHNRKNEHVSLSQKFHGDERDSSFHDLQFVHHSLPMIDVEEVSLETKIGNLSLQAPFFINAMTGGSPWTKKVNEKLAIVARETNLAIATGSVSAGLKTPEVADSYRIVREVNPHGLVFANLGAGHGLENAKKAVDLLQADAFQIHVNAPQEVVMPEGDRTFRDWLSNIEEIVEGLDVPVIVKEVGFGMSRETIAQLRSVGVEHIDISGTGGTNFAQIENYRRREDKMDDIEEWGQSTAVSLLEAASFLPEMTLISSGGIRRPIEVAKSLALGASAVGVSSHFLHFVLREGVDETIQIIEAWKKELTRMMTLLSAPSVSQMNRTDLVIKGDTRDWCEARDINWKAYVKRSTNSSI